jgi:pimeloyl-ACP methyl ester carboxylesterase
VTPLWRRLGYQPHIYCFGWNGSADALTKKQRLLREYVDALGVDNLYVIGVSAGGTAAANLLRDRPAIEKIVIVASPLRPKDHPANELLATSAAETDALLTGASSDLKQKITSVHGLRDWRVPVPKSQHSDIRTVRLPILGHTLIIAAALTVYSRLLDSQLAHASYDPLVTL